jgi:hypothetical protein
VGADLMPRLDDPAHYLGVVRRAPPFNEKRRRNGVPRKHGQHPIDPAPWGIHPIRQCSTSIAMPQQVERLPEVVERQRDQAGRAIGPGRPAKCHAVAPIVRREYSEPTLPAARPKSIAPITTPQ